MDFSKRKRVNIETERKGENYALNLLLVHNCAFYILPPLIDEFPVSDFEELAIERLKVLRTLEQASQTKRIYSEEWKEYIIHDLKEQGLKHYIRLMMGNDNKEADMNARRRDYISHFILRFAYCRSEELRRWFTAREMELFRMKFVGLSVQEIKDFLEVYQMDYKPLTEDQKVDIWDGFQACTQNTLKVETIYKVHFLEVLDLVKSRKCYLKDGFAYVSTMDFVSIIGSRHQEFIEKGLLHHLALLPKIQKDKRLIQIIQGLHTTYSGKDYTVSKENAVPIESLDQLSLKSFPICMKQTHDALREKHHLKHGGRQQYSLFLKAIGVSIEDALKFWRDEFSKTMDPDKFDKQYAYNIRHNYGKEGSRVNYSPYSCMKIITTAVGPQDVCGCPFKMWDSALLRSKLTASGISPMHVQEIMTFSTKGHFQLACNRTFEITHDTKLDEGINHPNQYFELSQIVMGTRQPKSKEKNQQSTQQAAYNNRKQNQASQQQAFKKKLDQRGNINNTDFDDELWKMSQAEEESRDVKAVFETKNAIPSTSTQITESDWGDEDDLDFSDANLTLNYF